MAPKKKAGGAKKKGGAGKKKASAAPAVELDSRELQALGILLQPGSPLRSDQAAICRLLAASKATAAAVAAACGGQLAIDFDPEARMGGGLQPDARVAAQRAWLRCNGGLLRALSCTYKVAGGTAGRGKLALLTLLSTITSKAPQLSKLTAEVDLECINKAQLTKLADSFADLSLQDVRLCIRGAHKLGGPAPLLAGLQRLPALTHCELSVMGIGPGFMHIDKAGLDRLPTSLQTLRLSVRLGLHDMDLEMVLFEAGAGEIAACGEEGIDMTAGWGRPYPSTPQPAMLLGHLTALQELMRPETGYGMADLDIRAGDVLPPALTTLILDADHRSIGGLLTGPLSAATIQPLLPLMRLQTLTIFSSKATAAQLQQLGAALKPPRGALQEVSLGYESLGFAKAASAGWPSLPLVSLRISTSNTSHFYNQDAEADVDAAMLASLSHLTQLTALRVTDSDVKWTASAQETATALAALTSLQEVELEGSFKPLHADDGDSLAPFNALAALPNLRSLALGGKWRRAPMPISAAALAASASAKQLTYLALAGLTDADMELLTPALASPEVLDTKANKPWW